MIEEPTPVADAMEADEVFTSGTAVVLCSVGSLTYKGKRRNFSTEEGKPGADALVYKMTNLTLEIIVRQNFSMKNH